MTDTAEKLRSAAGVPFLPLGPGVTPNASKDIEWRAQAAWGYSGISAFSAPSEVLTPFVYRRPSRLRARKRDIDRS